MIPVLGAGGLVGLGAFLVGRALFPPKPSLAMVLARVNGASTHTVTTLSPSRPWAARVGPPVGATLERLNIGLGDLESDLAVVGRGVDDHMAVLDANDFGGDDFTNAGFCMLQRLREHIGKRF